jgi:CHAT domain-containing protein
MDPRAEEVVLAGRARELEASYFEFESALARAEREQAGALHLTAFEALPISRVQAALPAGTVGLSYTFAGMDPGDGVVLAVGSRSCELVVLERAPREIADDVKTWLELLRTGSAGEAEAAARVHDALLKPLESRLEGCERVVVVPDYFLGEMPFGALLRREGAVRRRAVELHEFVYAPSLTAFARLLERPGPDPRGARRLVALADPESALHTRLPATRAEVAAIAALFPPGGAVTLVGAEATRDRLRRELAAASGDLVLHFACHGEPDAARPLLNGLVLSGDEIFGLADLVDVRARASLAVLSCCESGRARFELGENLLGWSRELLELGVPRVVVANWRIDDARTGPLMARFHQAIRRDRLAPAAALRGVQLEALRSGGPDAEPRVWAPFVLWGRFD